MRRLKQILLVAVVLAALTACVPPAPQVTSKVSCAGTPVEGAIRTAFAGTGDEVWALAVAARESGCNPCAYYPSRSDCTSGGINPRSAKGLFQLVNHDDLILAACPALYVAWNNPVCGAWAARYLYEGSGRRPWGG